MFAHSPATADVMVLSGFVGGWQVADLMMRSSRDGGDLEELALVMSERDHLQRQLADLQTRTDALVICPSISVIESHSHLSVSIAKRGTCQGSRAGSA